MRHANLYNINKQAVFEIETKRKIQECSIKVGEFEY